jgi:DNA-binding NarL/FixJ family response regulator
VKKERKILIASQSHFVNGLLEAFIHMNGYGKVTAKAADGKQALEAAKKEQPDCVVMENVLHIVSSLEVVKTIRKEMAGVTIIVFSIRRIDLIQAVRLVKAGARGYLPLLDDAAALKRTFEAVWAGRTSFPKELAELLAERDFEMERQKYLRLTTRELEIVHYVALGYSNSEIGWECRVSSRTVEEHRRRVCMKTGLRTTADLTRFAIAEGLVAI